LKETIASPSPERREEIENDDWILTKNARIAREFNLNAREMSKLKAI
jgi:hypothetical protein